MPSAEQPPSPERDARTASHGIADAADWRDAVMQRIPALRAFAWSLSRNSSDADDLVQETLTKAWTYREKFEAGSNLRAWLFTILRNSWYTSVAKRRREVADEEGRHAAGLVSEGNQAWSVELIQLRAALDTLPPEHREAIILVGAAGLSYEEAAEIVGCAVGTIKSRVNRARNKLAALVDQPRAPPNPPISEFT
ncbi:sigma-70 family RNA polymerase sigma factor [Brevundimonas sp.]|uniref:sigma-70 family RNA polymerase sigma factor n=1 Tax=Brevundimonas sp. TaxID=1871086 RepID=UPI002ABC0C04|nr:sigma-70 family RNA polymerase sigma factor [Brevundimonas sp.]MDZ4364578.1 sigma-70 family RNA polymerase sigma factor [Brevundimonas sp.]